MSLLLLVLGRLLKELYVLKLKEFYSRDSLLNLSNFSYNMEDKGKIVDALKLFMEKTVAPTLG